MQSHHRIQLGPGDWNPVLVFLPALLSDQQQCFLRQPDQVGRAFVSLPAMERMSQEAAKPNGLFYDGVDFTLSLQGPPHFPVSRHLRVPQFEFHGTGLDQRADGRLLLLPSEFHNHSPLAG